MESAQRKRNHGEEHYVKQQYSKLTKERWMISRRQEGLQEKHIFRKGDGDSEDAVYYMESEGEFWGEISNKKFHKNGVIAARLVEIKQVHSHGVYEKVTLEEYWDQIGKALIKTKWVDISKGDEPHEGRTQKQASG